MLNWVRFEDGPAKGRSLTLARAPVFLRVVTAGGQWDALDQLDDMPKPEELIFVYRHTGEVGALHLDRTLKDPKTGRSRRVGEWYATAAYRVVDPQPADATMRDASAWQAWCLAQVLTEKQPAPG